MIEIKKPRRTLASYNFATESIDFQTDKFGSQIEAILYDMEKFIDKAGTWEQMRQRLADSELVPLLAELIFKRTGIKVKLIVKTDMPGAIMPMFYNENHVLLNPAWHNSEGLGLKDQTKLIKQSRNAIGTVDLVHAKVGGIFSEYTHDLFVDVVGNINYWKMTIPEITGIILHELGHAFTYYELANRLESTNQVLVDLSKEIKDNKSPEKRQYVLKELAKSFGVKEQEFDDIINEKNNVIFGLKLFAKYVKFVKSQMPNAKYNQTASEQVADNFAARFGYGRHLITALEHFSEGSPEKNGLRGPFGIMIDFLIGVILPGILAIAGIVSYSPIIGIYILILMVVMLFISGDAAVDMTYDATKIRYKRIRQQSIEMIKRLNLPKEELRSLIDNIHFMDEIINKTFIHRTIYNRLANFLFSWNRAVKKDIELQYLIEDLTHNDLFLASAELEVLS